MASNLRGIFDLTTGTVSVTSGGTVVTFSGTSLTGVDQRNGETIYFAGAGDFIKIGTGFQPVMVDSVDVSGTTLTLAAPWPNATQTNVSYYLRRYSAVPTGDFARLWNYNASLGSDTTPDTSRTVDNGSARGKLRVQSGKFEVAIGPSGTADASLKAALQMDPATGAVSFPFGTGAGTKPSLRNKLRNPSFQVNQRAVAGTVTLAAGAFGHDGVKAGDAGATYTFANVGQDVRITVTAGSIILPVEANLIDAGSYALSHEGAAQARVWQGTGTTGSGSYAAATRASPLIVTGLTANTQTNIEFSTGTILRPQFEPGVGVGDYDRRGLHDEILYCRRYFQRVFYRGGVVGIARNATVVLLYTLFLAQMRATPTAALVSNDAQVNVFALAGTFTGGTLSLTTTAMTSSGGYVVMDGLSGLTTGQVLLGAANAALLDLSAEI